MNLEKLDDPHVDLRSIRRELAFEWLRSLPALLPMEVTSNTTIGNEPRLHWLCRDCVITGSCPAFLYGAFFDGCRFEPFWRGVPFSGPLVLRRCSVSMESADEDLALFASETRFERVPGRTPHVEGPAWLHECELSDVGAMFNRSGYILSGQSGVTVHGRLKERVPADTSGWALAALFSDWTGATSGARLESVERTELNAVRAVYWESFGRRRLRRTLWYNVGDGGFAMVAGPNGAVFRWTRDGTLEFWSGTLAAAFADERLGLVEDELWLPVVDERASPLPRSASPSVRAGVP